MTKNISSLERYPAYEVVIGIEVHVQLNTKSKIFCSCPTMSSSGVSANLEPNSNICIVCSGHPGTLPVLNKQVIDYAIMAGHATNSTIALVSFFDRKHYFYPDLPKGYQITQQFQPICEHGSITIRTEDGSLKNIRLKRIHIEEDAGKNSHITDTQQSFVDLNRAGTPLLEMVSEPDISSSYEARKYLETLRSIVQYLGICTGNMQDGAFRADTNISVRKKGATELGTKCELKNINSFKFIGDAIEYEIERQIQLIERGEKVGQETRSWNPHLKKTSTMRVKEEAADYRYFQDPDLPAIVLSQAWLDAIKQIMPELAQAKAERFMTQGMSREQAEILVSSLTLANYYENAKKHTASPALVHWILRDVLGYLNEHKIEINDFLLSAQKLGMLVDLLDQGVINNISAKELFIAIAQSGKEPALLMKEMGLEQVCNAQELETIIQALLNDYPDVVVEYKSGKERLFGFFVGHVMKKTDGKANPKLIQELLRKHLSAGQ